MVAGEMVSNFCLTSGERTSSSCFSNFSIIQGREGASLFPQGQLKMIQIFFKEVSNSLS
jgi:hypothetical protein